MKHGNTNRRHRSRGNQQRRGGNQRMQVFDSNGPDVRIRGTANQVAEKYIALAKDASSSGDIVLAESYLQHAEHYQRVINAWNIPDEKVSSDQPKEQNKEEQNASGNDKANNKKEEDLSLPASILGGDVEVKPQEAAELTA
ncbi:MAG: DUF4167 domain-containing protein [Alphaproteobacteria bacterium]